MFSQCYSFVESMDPENIIMRKKNIPRLMFEYFVQKNVALLITLNLMTWASTQRNGIHR